MKKVSFTLRLIVNFILVYSMAWGNFYVIGAGTRAKQTILVSPKSTAADSGTALLNTAGPVNF